MKKMLKPASLLLYLQALILFFTIGATFAAYSGKAEGQGLAGGAIIISYGILLAAIAFLVSLFVAWNAPVKTIIRLNKLLFAFELFFTLTIIYRYCDFYDNGNTSNEKEETLYKSVAFSVVQNNIAQEQDNKTVGLGFFKPDFINNSTIYFYGSKVVELPDRDMQPTDSLVFIKKTSGAYEILYAPPWFYPEHLKMDYGVLYTKVVSVGRNFVEIEVNKQTQQTTFVSREIGTTLFWPEFLLTINSVEFDNNDQKVRVKPLSYAGVVTLSFAFMRPVRVRQNWMKVNLLDDNFRTIGSGWIKWRKDGEMLISYSLLS